MIKDTASGLLRVEYGDHETLFIEEFRADVNGDGIEELVVYWAGRPLHGTLRVSGILTLMKTTEEGLFEALVE